MDSAKERRFIGIFLTVLIAFGNAEWMNINIQIVADLDVINLANWPN